MANFIIVDDAGVIYGSAQAISAAYVIGNVTAGLKLVETERFYRDPSQYRFDWDTREVRSLPSAGDQGIMQDSEPNTGASQ